jgi:hypothetical protein
MAAGAISFWKTPQGHSTFAPGLMRTGVLKSEIYNFTSEYQYKNVARTHTYTAVRSRSRRSTYNTDKILCDLISYEDTSPS